MEYTKLVEKLSQKTGIDKEIFDLSELNNPENIRVVVSNKEQKLENVYCEKYYYSQRYSERWKSVTLLISKDIIEEFLTLLNEIYEEENEEVPKSDLKDDMSHIFSRSIIHNGLFQIHREKNDNYYRIEFAKKDIE